MADIFSNIDRLLILQLSKDVQACEINAVTQAAENLQLGYHREPLLTRENLGSLASLCGSSQYDLVYICGHGDETTIGEPDDSISQVTWPQLSAVLCNSLTADASFFLSCCDGGLESVATDLFVGCDELKYVFGVPQTAYPWQLVSAFTNVLTQLRVGATPEEAAKTAEASLQPPLGNLDPNVQSFRFESYVRGDSTSEASIELARNSIVERYEHRSQPIELGKDCWDDNGQEICGTLSIDSSGRDVLLNVVLASDQESSGSGPGGAPRLV